MKIYSILQRPVITEKSSAGNEKGIYSFIVSNDANKIDVQNAIQTLYKVKVKKVNIVSVKPKTRLVKGRKLITKRPSQKKAIVTLQGGKSIDINKFVEKK